MGRHRGISSSTSRGHKGEGIAALGPKPKTTKPAAGHKILPYLLRDLKVAAGTFEARVRQLIAGNPLLVEVVEALLKVWGITGEQLVTLHRRVLRLAQTDETCHRLMAR